MTDTHLRTYRITDHRATLRERPMGKRMHGLVVDQLFQGRPAPGRADWIMRVDDDGVTPRGYVRAALCTALDMPASMRMLQELPQADTLGDTVDRLAAWLALGRSQERHRAITALLGDYAGEVVRRAASQAADVTTRLLVRLERREAEIALLEQRVVALEGLRERAVGET